jgi:hypothetical protein
MKMDSIQSDCVIFHEALFSFVHRSWPLLLQHSVSWFAVRPGDILCLFRTNEKHARG